MPGLSLEVSPNIHFHEEIRLMSAEFGVKQTNKLLLIMLNELLDPRFVSLGRFNFT